MPIRLYLIWGATTTGKTAQSVALARATGAPVISLDRVQCCQELAVGSGRPSPSDLLGTRREYLCDRSVSSGVIPAADANQLLFDKVVRYSAHERALILEGGSVSLINAMIRDERWSEQGEWALRRIALPGRAVFMAQAIKRVRDMLEPPPGHAGILDELGGPVGASRESCRPGRCRRIPADHPLCASIAGAHRPDHLDRPAHDGDPRGADRAGVLGACAVAGAGVSRHSGHVAPRG